MKMKIIIPGVSAGDGESDNKQLAFRFAEIMKCPVESVVVFNPEYYFDKSHMNWMTKLAVWAGMQLLKAKFPGDYDRIAEQARDKSLDVWLYLNPFYKRTRDTVDEALAKILKAYPDADVYAHSLGSVVAFRALKISRTGYTDINLVTLGSPLWMKLVQWFLDVQLNGLVTVKSWFNYYGGMKDPIALKAIDTKLGIPLENQFITHTTHDLEEYLNFLVQQQAQAG